MRAAPHPGRAGPNDRAGSLRETVELRRDRALFDYLLDHRREIRRKVIQLPNGIESLTETDVPETRARLQAHVQAMSRRLREHRPVHERDPLFAEIFRCADRIDVDVGQTSLGVRVKVTSSDAYVVRLIQAHADVIDQFVGRGRREVRRNHSVPSG